MILTSKQFNNVLRLILLSSLIAGCATNADGQKEIGFGRASLSKEQLDQAIEQLKENSEKEAIKTGVSKAAEIDGSVGTIVIGEVGVLQRINEEEQAQLYDMYVETQRNMYNREPSVSLEYFKSKVVGTSSIEVFYIPGVMSRRSQAIISPELINKIDFPSFNKSYFFGSTGDLVAVKPAFDDVMLIDQILCKKSDKEFKSCANSYSKGVFDKNTGQELDSKSRPKENGSRINPVNYKLVN